MSKELTIPQGFGAPSKLFANTTASNDDLGAGVASSYAIVGYRGKVWSTKFGGTETPLMRDDGDGPRGSIEVVIVKAAAAVSKIFYKNGYVEGSNSPPDCWSSNGVTPDAGAKDKQCATCAQCPMNAWGSRVTDAGKNGKQCSDSRRVAVVPANDIANEVMGGPMLLRVPAASLKDLKTYGEHLSSFQYPYFGVATRIAFDPKDAYPKFVFTPIRPLNDAEAKQILELRDDQRVKQILSETAETMGQGQAQEAAKPVPKSIFEQPAPKAQAAPKAPPAAPKAQETAPSEAPGEVGTQTPEEFDKLLDELL